MLLESKRTHRYSSNFSWLLWVKYYPEMSLIPLSPQGLVQVSYLLPYVNIKIVEILI